MSFADKAVARAERLAAERQRARIMAIAGELDGIAGVRATSAADAVVIEGRGLARRWLSDARLRFVAGAGR